MFVELREIVGEGEDAGPQCGCNLSVALGKQETENALESQ
jgi:hypothetical protein